MFQTISTIVTSVPTMIMVAFGAGAPALPSAPGTITFPAKLQHLATAPTGLGGFGSQVVFPIFYDLGPGSTVDAYNITTDTLTTYPMPSSLIGQQAEATAADTGRNLLWIGTENNLVRFDVTTHAATVYSLPTPAYRYYAPFEVGPGGALGPAAVQDLALASDGSLWITRDHNSGLTHFDPATGTFSQIPLPYKIVPGFIALAGAGLAVVHVAFTGDPKYMIGPANGNVGYLVVNLQTGSSRFVAVPTSGVFGAGKGQVIRVGHLVLTRVDVNAGTDVPVGAINDEDLLPGAALSSDGSMWVSDWGQIEHVVGKAITTYSIPQLVISWLPSEREHPITKPIPLNPQARAVAVGTNGDVWFVATGYNAIGHLTP